MNDWDLRLSLLKKIEYQPLDNCNIKSDAEHSALASLCFLDLVCCRHVFHITKSGRAYLDGLRASNLEKINDNS